jgi:predicted ATPase
MINTEARRITLEETLRFEKIHVETYCNFGFELVNIEPGKVQERARNIKSFLNLSDVQHA